MNLDRPPGNPHLETHVHGAVSNLVDIWQRPSVVLTPILAQLQVLALLQLHLEDTETRRREASNIYAMQFLCMQRKLQKFLVGVKENNDHKQPCHMQSMLMKYFLGQWSKVFNNNNGTYCRSKCIYTQHFHCVS